MIQVHQFRRNCCLRFGVILLGLLSMAVSACLVEPHETAEPTTVSTDTLTDDSIDMPFEQQVKRTASDPDERDQFGESVALDGDRAIVGAFHDGELGEIAGAAYIFERQGPGLDDWVEVAKLTASNGEAEDWFGLAVDIEGDIAAVGAPFSGTRGSHYGSVYIFERTENGGWQEIQRIVSADGSAYDDFGTAVTLDEARLAVGAPMPQKGRILSHMQDRIQIAGRVYLFERQPNGRWRESATFEPTENREGTRFGMAVDLEGDVLAVGAPGHDVPNTLGGPRELLDSMSDEERKLFSDAVHSGAVYVFERDTQRTWSETARLEPDGTERLIGPLFGFSVALEDSVLVVGAPGDSSLGDDVGSAFVFEREAGGAWGQTHVLTPSSVMAPSFYGIELALDLPWLAVGAHFYGPELSTRGTVFMLTHSEDGADWIEVDRLEAADSHDSQSFGGTVALDEGTLLVGALNDDEKAPNAGAVYFFGAAEPQ